jgi:hypothetical protein
MQAASASNPGTDARVVARKFTRARIIAHIRGIAAENGGVPPGKMQFQSKTGIKPSAWAGRLWARWSDALREAGFAPNARTSRLRDDDMLGWLADAARLFGCIPATTDMEMYRSSGRRLPCHQAFMHHFGSKAGMLRSLKRWAAASPERADIAAMLDGIVEEPDPPRRIMGAVYLLRSGRSYKIGCSRAPQQRVRDVQQSLPQPARLVHAIDTDDPYGIEAYWHRRFAEKRSRGEWFKLSADDVAAFRQRQFQ